MPTLKVSPEATSVLTDIEVEEVSIVDMPANGEPFVVVKSLEGGQSSIQEKKESTNMGDIKFSPEFRSELKKRAGEIDVALGATINTAKALPTSTSTGDDVPSSLRDTAKSIGKCLRMVAKAITKNDVAVISAPVQIEVAKAVGATSYVYRDSFVDILTGVRESIHTYLDPIETMDDGPMFMQLPSSLNDTSVQLGVSGDDEEEETTKVADAASTTNASVQTDTKKSVETQSDNDLRSMLVDIRKGIETLVVLTTRKDMNPTATDKKPEDEVVVPAVAPADTTVVVTTPAPTTDVVVVAPVATAPVVEDVLVQKMQLMLASFETKFSEISKKLDERVVAVEKRTEKFETARGEDRSSSPDGEKSPVAKSNKSIFHGII